ncbi:hypothetical protein BGZ94_000273 [Podila epigama]|nr:hypothetical protein BGZ94_000273 [Podila epigama]
MSRKLFFLDLSLVTRKKSIVVSRTLPSTSANAIANSGGGCCNSSHEEEATLETRMSSDGSVKAETNSQWEDVVLSAESYQHFGHDTGQGNGAVEPQLQRLEVIARFPTHTLSDLDDLWHRVKLGAVVRIYGDIETTERRQWVDGIDNQQRGPRSSVLLHCLEFEVLENWLGKEPFEPNPGSAVMSAMKFTGKGSSTKKKQDSSIEETEVPNKKRRGTNSNLVGTSPTVGSTQATVLPNSGDSTQPHCKFWLNSGKCHKQQCEFWHETDPVKLKAERRRWVQERIQSKRQISHHSCDPHQKTTKNQHRERSLYFAQWLIDTFSRALLDSGSGVLDIAGGRGDLSWELQTRQGIRSTIIEPRPGKGMRKWQRRWLEKFIADNKAVSVSRNDSATVVLHRDQDQNESKKVVIMGDPNVSNGDEDAAKKQQGTTDSGDDEDDDDDGGVDEDRETGVGGQSMKLAGFIPTVKTHALQGTEPARIQAMLDDEFLKTHETLLESASILIGLHPDQATEPIVRAALKARKPFAIIPCCVFGRDNPHRRLPLKDPLQPTDTSNNTSNEPWQTPSSMAPQAYQDENMTRPVTSYDDFVTWLMTLHPGIETTWLDFEGMNRVLFWRGENI